MRGKINIMSFACLLSIIMLFSPQAFAQSTTYITDILNNPTRFMNMTVIISGRVQESNPAGATSPGSYVLTDDSFGSITVLTYNPPAPGASITIEGIVQMDPTTQTPYVRELKVISGVPVSVWAGIAAVVVLILIVILIVILRKLSVRREAAVRPSTTGTRGATVGETAAKTERIRMTEFAGAAKTDKIPANPAQLEILTGDRKGEKVLLVMENVIGREKGNIRFGDKSVSREHARIRHAGGKYSVTNISLTNPTRINGEPVGDEQGLSEGDELQFGVIRAKFTFIV